MDEQDVKELLLRENAEFRRAYEDHQACEKAIDAIRGKSHPLPADADEEREFKKKKLVLKDRMYRLMADYLRTR
ncbi:MAG: YdcH family protein [Candidatus Aminicenantales bacterium]